MKELEIKVDYLMFKDILKFNQKERSGILRLIEAHAEGLPMNVDAPTKAMTYFKSIKKGIKRKKTTTRVNLKVPLKERKKEFYQSLVPFVDKHGKETVRKFFNWWSEHNEDGNKMRWETRDIFNIGQRIARFKPKEDIKNKNVMPDYYSQKYEKTLDSNELPKYWKWLRENGWEKKQIGTGLSTWVESRK